jgi:hypothetical protein
MSVATPLLRFTAVGSPAPMVKLTTPEGVPIPLGLLPTVAVKVTVWPTTDGLGCESRLVVEAFLTVCSGASMARLGPKLASPP